MSVIVVLTREYLKNTIRRYLERWIKMPPKQPQPALPVPVPAEPNLVDLRLDNHKIEDVNQATPVAGTG